EAVDAGEHLDEGAEVDGALDHTLVDGADLGLGGEALDDVEGPLDGIRIRRGDVDGAVVLDVDGHAGLVDDAFDGLAARADDEADLVGLDLDRRDARRPLRELRPRSGERLRHLAEDEEPALAGLVEGLGEDLARKTRDLDVHLDGGDALRGPADLEVHVAEMVLVTEDVAQDREPLA